MPHEGQPDSSVPMDALRPVSREERIQIVDVLRGFAIFGILTVNMGFFRQPLLALVLGESQWEGPIDRFTQVAISFLFEGNVYPLFSMLFGFGMAIQMIRAKEKDRPFVGWYLRRLFFLFCFGVAHILFLWSGDILIAYSIFGSVLLLFRNRKNATLLKWAGGIIIAFAFLGTGAIVLMTFLGDALDTASVPPTTQFAETAPAEPAPAAPQTAPTATSAAPSVEPATQPNGRDDTLKHVRRLVDRTYEIYGHGSYLETMLLRVFEFALAMLFQVWLMGPIVMAMFLIGLYIGRTRRLADIEANLPFFRRSLQWGLLIGVIGNGMAAISQIAPSTQEHPLLAGMLFLGDFIGGPAMSMFYAASLILLSLRKQCARFLQYLAPVGRMALTNYLMQSLVCSLIFNGYGLGYYGKVSPAGGFVLTVSIYLAQVVFSNVWMSRFRFGPLEWLWRTLSYGKVQPLSRAN